MSVLRFDCRFGYPGGFALSFEFTAERGVTAIVGPSGSGKTTVLNLIAGLLTPADGEIELGETRLFNAQASINVPPEQRGIGFIFQDYQLFPHLSVEGNLQYGQRRTQRTHASFEHVVEVLELGSLLNRAPASLSGGEKQRVALGRALLCGPRLLLLDEPLNAVDARLRQAIGEFLSRAIAEFKIPAVLVSHDQESIAALAGEIVPINRP
jgi:molybdate transport system ATP-binding protein